MPRVVFPGLAMSLVFVTSGCTTPPHAAVPSATLAPPPARSVAASVTPSPESPSVSPSATVYAGLPIPAGTPRCHSNQLEVGLLGAGAATGNVRNSFEMRNRSANACWVYGYVGFQMLGSRGRPLPQTLSRSTDSFFGQSDPPTRILVPPGSPPLQSRAAGHAYFNVVSEDVTCSIEQMKATASLEIWPPDEYAALVIPAHGGDWNGGFIACGDLSVDPMQSGPALPAGDP